MAVTTVAEPFDDLDLLTPEGLREWWARRLRRVLRVARDELPFYQRRFGEVGFDPARLRTVDDLAGLRPFAKDDVLAEQRRLGSARIGLERLGKDPGRVVSMSSGTKGTSFLTWPPRWRTVQGRSSLRAHWWAGLRPGTPLVLAAPAWHAYAAVQTYIVEQLDLPAVVVAGTYLPTFSDRIVDAILAFRPRFVIMFLPMVFSLINEARRRGLPPRELFASVERLNAAGAPITPGMRAHVEAETGIGRLVEMAGSSENLLAVECDERQGLHVVPDTCYIEVVDRDTCGPVAAGERGRVLHSTTVPWGSIYLRYDSGDAGVIDHTPCPCGLPSPRVKLMGRWEDGFCLGERELLAYDVQQAIEEAVPELTGAPCVILREGLAAGQLRLLLQPGPDGHRRHLSTGVVNALAARFDVPVEVRWADALPVLFKGVTPVLEEGAVPRPGQRA